MKRDKEMLLINGKYSQTRAFVSLVLCGFFLISVTTSCLSPLMSAVYKNKAKEVEKRLSAGADVNKGIGGGPLVTAAANNNTEIVRMLIEHGADVNQGTMNNWTPLHFAAKNNNPEITKILIDKGANINVANKMGESPLKLAEEKGYSLVVRLLKDAEEKQYGRITGSDPTAVTDNKTLAAISDVDKDIPTNSLSRPNTYALIIGNEDYSTFQMGLSKEVNVDYAINDAKVFKEYCIKTLGVPEKQVKLLLNATAGQMNQGIAWINNLAMLDAGKAELIFYYSGHGLPDDKAREPYLIPVDISGNNITMGLKLTDIYSKLNEYSAQRVVVVLDACFSGGARNQGLISMKGVKVRPKENRMTGNMIVLSSSSGDESSGVYREKQHGFMTYFLLKKLQETKGSTTYKDLAESIIENVKKESALVGKMQSPQLNYSPDIEVVWPTWSVNN